MSVRSSLTGPFAEITVGTGDSAVVFNLPKALLCNTSSYFRAALSNGFFETKTQSICLDDEDPEVFRTFAAWLFQSEINKECLKEVPYIQDHLFQVYIFADKRGITSLGNDAVTILCSHWTSTHVDMHVTKKFLPAISSHCHLYHLALDNLILGWRQDYIFERNRYLEQFVSHSRAVMMDLLKKQRSFPIAFEDNEDCFQSICHYHDHDGEEEERVCIAKTESGRNIAANHAGPWSQVAWKW